MRWNSLSGAGWSVFSALSAWLGASHVQALEPLDAQFREGETCACAMATALSQLNLCRESATASCAGFAATEMTDAQS